MSKQAVYTSITDFDFEFALNAEHLFTLFVITLEHDWTISTMVKTLSILHLNFHVSLSIAVVTKEGFAFLVSCVWFHHKAKLVTVLELLIQWDQSNFLVESIVNESVCQSKFYVVKILLLFEFEDMVPGLYFQHLFFFLILFLAWIIHFQFKMKASLKFSNINLDFFTFYWRKFFLTIYSIKDFVFLN